MLQVPFGSTGPGWMTMSSPGLAWLPAPLAPVNPGSMSSHHLAGVEGGNLPVSHTPLGWGTSPTGLTVSAMPLATPMAVPDGVTAQGLLVAVAARRGQPQGPSTDQDVEEFIYDAVELLPGGGDVEVRCESGRVTLSGSVPHKRLKRDIGEIAWVIPGINDVQNTIAIATRRRSRAFSRETEAQPAVAAGRKS